MVSRGMNKLTGFVEHLLSLEDPDQAARDILDWSVRHYETDPLLACAPVSAGYFVKGTAINLMALVRLAQTEKLKDERVDAFLKFLVEKILVKDEKGLGRSSEEGTRWLGECTRACFLALAELGRQPTLDQQDAFLSRLSKEGIDPASLPWREPEPESADA